MNVLNFYVVMLHYIFVRLPIIHTTEKGDYIKVC